ncbi:MAG: 8-amino-7-oxononanoate synthase [Cyanobacteria bacterium P01_H01_bin.74]
MINFSSNDYLGLSDHPTLKANAIEAIHQFGTGTGSARLISGSLLLTHQLEESLARWKKAESALVFNSGYQANVAILQALLQPTDWVFCDRLNHASLIDGCLLSGARWTRYQHLDLDDLTRRLKKAPVKASKWIVTDSVFSMDGDYPDLGKLVAIAKGFGAQIILDEAHATGLYGDQYSSGLAEAFGVSKDIAVQISTFSKALGGTGAFVTGSKTIINQLINTARGFIYTTAPAPASIAAAQAAVDLIQADALSCQTGKDSLKKRLWQNVDLFSERLHWHKNNKHPVAEKLYENLAWPLKSPVIPIVIGSEENAVAASKHLEREGFFVHAICPPTVPEGTARLRISLSAAHTTDQVTGLVDALTRIQSSIS